MDAGAKRALAGAGVQILNVDGPERLDGSVPGEFAYRFYADGRQDLTHQHIERVLGVRASTDDACKGLSGIALDVKVQKMARANCDGNVARKLLGLQNYPADELVRLWAKLNPPRSLEKCNRGRGFGSREDRQGVGAQPNVAPPKCELCGATGVWRAGKDGKPDFYFCPEHQKHKPGKKWFQDAAQWVAKQTAAAAPSPARAAEAEGSGRSAAPQGTPAPAANLLERPCSICKLPAAAHANADHDWDPAE
jgi:hypothetical protein